MSASDVTTLVIAIIGAVTGVLGTGIAFWTAYRQVADDKVKLRVGASWAITPETVDTPFLVISVTNVSKFPITLRETGLLTQGDKMRSICIRTTLSNGERFPVRMEPRTSLSVYYPPDFLTSTDNKTASCAYASTDCGETFESARDTIPAMLEEANRRSTPATKSPT
jgi:hypothetical protein